ncbi:KTSC domain-containing protein [Erwinia sorbitola]|uniref:KTSC domain-containing protein n=1 Tax=Erwinia sorbitola TaxID=2681984 RepID=A0A6I6F4C8_9GAMM|nr:KTSC domain-containing protein [Erwinia sorbitola]MTD27187.1 KTSC domain-containing protein [Erwinia sorbitola]QGU88740.1 KTSC domain-containing protein [Erwinia sorbitola]
MKRQPVASSAIHSVGYDADKRILEVELRGSGTSTYRDVPLTTWHFFMAAPSKGLFFYQHINHRFSQH